VREANGGIVVKYQDISGLLDSIQNILDKKEEAKKLASNGMELVQRQFNWNEITKDMIKLYKTS